MRSLLRHGVQVLDSDPHHSFVYRFFRCSLILFLSPGREWLWPLASNRGQASKPAWHLARISTRGELVGFAGRAGVCPGLIEGLGEPRGCFLGRVGSGCGHRDGCSAGSRPGSPAGRLTRAPTTGGPVFHGRVPRGCLRAGWGGAQGPPGCILDRAGYGWPPRRV